MKGSSELCFHFLSLNILCAGGSVKAEFGDKRTVKPTFSLTCPTHLFTRCALDYTHMTLETCKKNDVALALKYYQ